MMVLAGGLAGGFVTGLTGFGTGLIAMPFWLQVLAPVTAAPLVALGGAASLLQTFATIRKDLTWRHVGPMTVAGIFGVPVGVWLLPSVSAGTFKLVVGVLLVVFCLFVMLVPADWRFRVRRRMPEVLFGLVGGFMGGLVGIPGPPAIIWGTLQSWSQHDKRALYQVFNLVTLSLMVVSSAIAGHMTITVLSAALIALPGMMAGAWLGAIAYRHLDGHRFEKIVLTILMLSGVALIASR